MMKKSILAAMSLCTGLAASTAFAGAGIQPLTTELVVSGLVRPIFVTHAPGHTPFIYIIEKQGRIRLYNINVGVLGPIPFLDIDALVGGGTTTNSEQGLLGLAFHPDYQTNGFFYVYYTNNSGNTVVARYTRGPNPSFADAGSALQIMTFSQPQPNHNGGWLGFGPDGYLYISTGDGGGGGDTGLGHDETAGNGQFLGTLLGKMLRIDVDNDDFPADPNRNYAIPADNPFAAAGDSALDEIWAYGLRNPWRPSFDRSTGDLYIADVGQNAIEEINFQPANETGALPGEAGYQGGINYGWRCWEGNQAFNPTNCGPAAGMEFPIHTYNHGSGVSVTGGYVYRGCDIPDLQGTYFFADYGFAQIWSFTYDGGSLTNFTSRTAELDPPGVLSIGNITSFGEDIHGEMYVCDQSGGEVFRIIPVTPPVAGDLNGDSLVNGLDLGMVLANWSIPAGSPACGGGVPCCVDINGDGVIDGLDLGIILANWTL